MLSKLINDIHGGHFQIWLPENAMDITVRQSMALLLYKSQQPVDDKDQVEYISPIEMLSVISGRSPVYLTATLLPEYVDYAVECWDQAALEHLNDVKIYKYKPKTIKIWHKGSMHRLKLSEIVKQPVIAFIEAKNIIDNEINRLMDLYQDEWRHHFNISKDSSQALYNLFKADDLYSSISLQDLYYIAEYRSKQSNHDDIKKPSLASRLKARNNRGKTK